MRSESPRVLWRPPHAASYHPIKGARYAHRRTSADRAEGEQPKHGREDVHHAGWRPRQSLIVRLAPATPSAYGIADAIGCATLTLVCSLGDLAPARAREGLSYAQSTSCPSGT